jgi:hypothetical protein
MSVSHTLTTFRSLKQSLEGKLLSHHLRMGWSCQHYLCVCSVFATVKAFWRSYDLKDLLDVGSWVLAGRSR